MNTEVVINKQYFRLIKHSRLLEYVKLDSMNVSNIPKTEIGYYTLEFSDEFEALFKLSGVRFNERMNRMKDDEYCVITNNIGTRSIHLEVYKYKCLVVYVDLNVIYIDKCKHCQRHKINDVSHLLKTIERHDITGIIHGKNCILSYDSSIYQPQIGLNIEYIILIPKYNIHIELYDEYKDVNDFNESLKLIVSKLDHIRIYTTIDDKYTYSAFDYSNSSVYITYKIPGYPKNVNAAGTITTRYSYTLVCNNISAKITEQEGLRSLLTNYLIKDDTSSFTINASKVKSARKI